LGFGGRGGASGTPSGMMTDTARALRDVSGDILAEQNKALQAGYSEAGALSRADLERQANLASTAGQLGGQDASRQLAGAEQLGGLAQMQQTLGLTGANAVTGVGAQQQGQAQKNIDVPVADRRGNPHVPRRCRSRAEGRQRGRHHAYRIDAPEHGRDDLGRAYGGRCTS
jgi:hypothetical protein